MKENDIHTSDVKSPDGTRNTQRTTPLPSHLFLSRTNISSSSGVQGQRGGGEGREGGRIPFIGIEATMKRE